MRVPCADVIIAWANGEDVEFYSFRDNKWYDCSNQPLFSRSGSQLYRVKPPKPSDVDEYCGFPQVLP